jgi:hypothetical protein
MKSDKNYNHYIEIRSQIRKLIKETLIGEEYPSSWNIDEFKELNSFKSRVDYCNANLSRISSGSGRIVYKIDDEKVLKLARNAKGIAQNEVEIEYGNYYDISDIVAQVFDYHDKGLWTEMELAKKVNPSNFKETVGVTFPEYVSALNYHYFNDIKPSKTSSYPKPENMDDMWENEFIYSMLNFMSNYDVPVGDLRRLSTYGLVNRDGVNTIVMVDYGLTHDVYNDYYL